MKYAHPENEGAPNEEYQEVNIREHMETVENVPSTSTISGQSNENQASSLRFEIPEELDNWSESEYEDISFEFDSQDDEIEVSFLLKSYSFSYMNLYVVKLNY